MEKTVRQRKRRFFAMLMVMMLLLPVLALAEKYTIETDDYNYSSDFKVGDKLKAGDTISMDGDASTIKIIYCDFNSEKIVSDSLYNSAITIAEYDEVNQNSSENSEKFYAWEIIQIDVSCGGSYVDITVKAVPPTPIEKIEITVEAPKVGAVCTYEYSITVTPDVDYIKESSNIGVNWSYVDEEAELYWTYVSEGSKYEAGKRYSPYFTIPLKDGLTVTDKTVISVNGVELEFNSKPGNEDKANYENWYKYDSSLNLVKVQYVFDELVKAPEDPTNPEKPASNDKPANTEKPAANDKPAGTDKGKDTAPKTGDSMNVIVLMTIAMVSVGTASYVVSKRKEEQ